MTTQRLQPTTPRNVENYTDPDRFLATHLVLLFKGVFGLAGRFELLAEAALLQLVLVVLGQSVGKKNMESLHTLMLGMLSWCGGGERGTWSSLMSFNIMG